MRSERDASLDSHPLAAHAPLRGATGVGINLNLGVLGLAG